MIEKRCQKVKVSGTKSTAIADLESMWPGILNHCFIKDRQSARFEGVKDSLDGDSYVVQVDLSENYQTFYQVEIQSAHFAYNQVTLSHAVFGLSLV